ncbi:MAG: FAD-binding oxidoreductase [Desulfovibrionaceae bacterium]|nr:FAD-binding oxidoreductase [Desulfovibrionaceae bacterium]
MIRKGPHISIPQNYVVNRILKINIDEFLDWPESVRTLAIAIAEELFLVAYNPFIDVRTVRRSVDETFERESVSLSHYYATAISEGITMFWSAYTAEATFRDRLIEALSEIVSSECILSDAQALIAMATDATDLRMELPLLVVEPDSTEQVAKIVHLANDMKFAIIPRGGGSGMTGGAVPARRRTVILSMTRLTHIGPIDCENMTMTCQAGVITQTAITAVDKAGAFFSVDPASKQASTIGGNISENAGGPSAFEYGTTIDNLLWWRMVTPTGEIILVERANHPRHKILPDETAVFHVKDQRGGVLRTIELRGDEIRLPGLGKDVTNKALGGLPGVQKEGTDGIITEACFVTHKKPHIKRVMALEFFGHTMRSAAIVVKELVALRNRVRAEGDFARLSAIEEFNVKYVQALEYQTKSRQYSGQPISVIILQVDGDDAALLDNLVADIVRVVEKVDNVDIIVARDEKEAEHFWEDRHRLSVIAKRTSGFKLNEDVVIPVSHIPDFALFLEQVNLECTAQAYRSALQEVERLPGFPVEDTELNEEFSIATQAAKGRVTTSELTDADMLKGAQAFLERLTVKYPKLAKKIKRIAAHMDASRLIVASHMHAGDGNCHVNIPVNSNDHDMLERAEKTAFRIMAHCQEIGGEVSGEHGIGITKIAFLSQEKMDAFRIFKEQVDPRDVMNPAKLVVRELPVKPFTFSFNRLLADINESGLSDKETLRALLTSIQTCTRCGKCKHVCAMVYPERSIQYHPRNKNMILGMLLEAVYYAQVVNGAIDDKLLDALRDVVEHCTACGRCMANCPVKIPSGEVALSLRAFLGHEGASGHPIKERALDFLQHNVGLRVPKAAKMASLGQKMQNNLLHFLPPSLRSRMQNPMFSGLGPKMGYTNLYESLRTSRGAIFTRTKDVAGVPLALYFPGCGGALFYDRIGQSSIMLLLAAGFAVAVPKQHLCCGYPLLAAGMDTAYEDTLAEARQYLVTLLRSLDKRGFGATYLVTSCGTCLESLSRAHLEDTFPNLEQRDVTQLVLPSLSPSLLTQPAENTPILYHGSCHIEWAGLHKVKGQAQIAAKLSEVTGYSVMLHPGCCGESGMGAISSPAIYNPLRERKQQSLANTFAAGYDGPVLVSCPSCKIGIGRCLINLNDRRRVLHVTEWLASRIDGEDRRQSFRKKVQETRGEVRVIPL